MEIKRKIDYRTIQWCLGILYTLFILRMTLIGRAFYSNHIFYGLFWELRRQMWGDILKNIILFVPLGFIFGGKKGIIFGIVMSGCIEVIQYFSRLGYCELDDLLNNIIGTIIGTILKKERVFLYKFFLKRVLDLLISIMVFPFFAIILIIIAPLIWFNDRGPIFYNASRLGKNGRIYKMYKFRSMKVNAPDIRNADGSTFNSENDPRVTSIGKLLRKTSLDEVPQFLNVLKGDMSLVGPRPHVISEGFKYENLPEEKKHRLLVKPGITGFNQAYYRNSVSSEEKIKNDNYYVDHISLLLDIKIVLHTIISVLKRDNINTVSSSNLSKNKVGKNK